MARYGFVNRFSRQARTACRAKRKRHTVSEPAQQAKQHAQQSSLASWLNTRGPPTNLMHCLSITGQIVGFGIIFWNFYQHFEQQKKERFNNLMSQAKNEYNRCETYVREANPFRGKN